MDGIRQIRPGRYQRRGEIPIASVISWRPPAPCCSTSVICLARIPLTTLCGLQKLSAKIHPGCVIENKPRRPTKPGEPTEHNLGILVCLVPVMKSAGTKKEARKPSNRFKVILAILKVNGECVKQFRTQP